MACSRNRFGSDQRSLLGLRQRPTLRATTGSLFLAALIAALIAILMPAWLTGRLGICARSFTRGRISASVPIATLAGWIWYMCGILRARGAGTGATALALSRMWRARLGPPTIGRAIIRFHAVRASGLAGLFSRACVRHRRRVTVFAVSLRLATPGVLTLPAQFRRRPAFRRLSAAIGVHHFLSPSRRATLQSMQLASDRFVAAKITASGAFANGFLGRAKHDRK
jgi:hypothetical protein